MSTDWIKVGAEVVYFFDSATAPDRHTRGTTIIKVNKNTFRVDHRDELFPIQVRPIIHNRYSAHVVVSAESDEGQRELRRARIAHARSKVDDAHLVWKRIPSPAYTAKLIETLETYQAVLAATPQETR